MMDWTRLRTRLTDLLSSSLLSTGVALLLGTWIAYSLAEQTWSLMQPDAPVVVAETENVVAVSAPDALALANQIAQSHLFGNPAVAARAPVTINAPETRLNLTLRGIVAAKEERDAVAIIQNAGRGEQHFVIGEKVFGLATLKEVYVDRVILMRNGRFETLRLPEKKVKLKASANPGLSSMSPATRELRILRAEVLSGKSKRLESMFELQGVSNKGRIIGFEVQAHNPAGRKLMQQVGLIPGDVVTGLNGQPIDNLDAMRERLNRLKQASTVLLNVDRKGRSITVPLQFGS